VTGRLDDRQGRPRDRLGHRPALLDEGQVDLAHHDERRDVDIREEREIVGLIADRPRHRRPHHRRERGELAVLELLVPGPLLEEALVRGVVERAARVEDLLEHRHALGERDLRTHLDELAVDRGDGTVRGVHEHERLETVRRGDRDAPGDHAAHRVAEQPDPLLTEVVGDRQDVGGHAVERVVVGRLRLGALAVAAVVEHHDPVVGGEPLDVVGEVLLRAAEAVHEEQRRTLAGDLDLEDGAVVDGDLHAGDPCSHPADRTTADRSGHSPPARASGATRSPRMGRGS